MSRFTTISYRLKVMYVDRSTEDDKPIASRDVLWVQGATAHDVVLSHVLATPYSKGRHAVLGALRRQL